MMPGNAKLRHPVVEQRTKDLVEYAETAPVNVIEKGESRKMGIITSSTSYQYVKEVFGNKYPVYKLGLIWPMPEKSILDFAASVDEVVVVEELDAFIETHCRNLGLNPKGKEIFSNIGEISQNMVAEKFGVNTQTGAKVDAVIPNRPPVMCAGCPHRGLFYTLSKNKITVIGDIGCYTLGAVAPLNAIDAVVCMGASISGLHGFNKSQNDATSGKSVAVIGDSTFMHSGMTGLVNIAYNNSNSTVIILDNSITGMTGHQQNPTTGFNLKGDPASKIDLEAFCKAVGIKRVRVVDPYDLAECDAVIKEELAAEEPSVIISRRPCALLKYVKHNKPLVVDADKCKSCKMCMKIGCPAISMKDGKAVIDATLCTGCGVCEQLCKFGALNKSEEA
jgi:indolepyruvate ferredoxin oxidoreductase alpha subunit